jgi:methionyl-tRNA synthetase
MARFKRACGVEVFFTTGTDEHGQKVEKAAQEKGLSGPKELADQVVKRYQELWVKLNISNDDFIRTTEERQHKAVTKFFQTVYDAGFIEKREYEGWYCVHEENFWPEPQLKQPGNLCPDCGRPAQHSSEMNFFFKQSEFKAVLKEYVLAHPDFIFPENRRNELLGSYLNAPDGVQDVSITRSNFKWGIPTPVDKDQVIYVWFDALINYLTVAGYGADEERFKRLWPADAHLIGKDILRQHALLWPSMLMAHKDKEHPQGLTLPRRVFGTGIILRDGVKMSKSLGNTVDPAEWADIYGVDVLRYYLLREVPFGQDGTVSLDSFKRRYESELANDLGNLCSRTLTMIEKYCSGKIPRTDLDENDELVKAGKAFAGKYFPRMENLVFHEAQEAVLELARLANRYVDGKAPWKLAKDPAKSGEVDRCLYNLAETLRLAAYALIPFMPVMAPKMLAQLGLEAESKIRPKGTLASGNLLEALKWGGLKPGTPTAKGLPLFPRAESAKP